MPKLIYFVACEKIVTSEEEKTASLISLLEQINSPAPPTDVEKPQAAMKWAVVSHWQKIPGDESKKYEQRTCLISPDEQEAAVAILEFGFTKEANFHRNVVSVMGFPLSPDGEYHVRLSVREVGKQDWTDLADYPILLIYIN